MTSNIKIPSRQNFINDNYSLRSESRDKNKTKTLRIGKFKFDSLSDIIDQVDNLFKEYSKDDDLDSIELIPGISVDDTEFIEWVLSANNNICIDDCLKDIIRQYKKIANNGNVIIQLFLGNLYYFGLETNLLTIAIDYEEAIYWYQKAAQQGNHNACYSLYFCYVDLYDANGQPIDKPVNIKEAIRWLKKASELGNHDAQGELGEFYLSGNKGIKINIDEGVKWIKKAYESENREKYYRIIEKAYFNLTTMDSEDAFEMDPPIEVISQYAKYGSCCAQCDLGKCYFSGTNVEKNVNTALYWLEKAAEQKEYYSKLNYYELAEEKSYGSSEAAFNLGEIYLRGTEVEKNAQTAFNWYMKSARLGHLLAISSISECYKNGIGVDADLEKSKKWDDLDKELCKDWFYDYKTFIKRNNL